MKAMETIDVPLSWLKSSRMYARLQFEGRLDGPPTAEDMRRRGYVINEYTWPTNGRPLDFDRARIAKGHKGHDR